MTSLPQTRPGTLPAQDARRRTPATAMPADGFSPARGRARQPVPTIDPSTVFGCVDWFLYPEQAVGRSAGEAQGKRARA
jgi:hypothetical protein